MKTLLSLILATSLVGCATCREHPVFCTTAAVFVAGAVAAAAATHDSSHQGGAAYAAKRPVCSGGPC